MNCIQHPQGQLTLINVQKFWIPLEANHKAGAWELLNRNYSDPLRAYHTWEHIAGLFEKLSEFSDLITRADILILTAFWHDVVYQTRNDDGTQRADHDNVHDSAELFRQYTLLNKTDADAVYELIMATANHMQATAQNEYYPGFAADFDLFLDLDLSSLAAPWEEFLEDFSKIRYEFSWLPEIDFCRKQIQILENFSQNEGRLYRRPETREKWRNRALENLKRCIHDLKTRLAKHP